MMSGPDNREQKADGLADVRGMSHPVADRRAVRTLHRLTLLWTRRATRPARAAVPAIRPIERSFLTVPLLGLSGLLPCCPGPWDWSGLLIGGPMAATPAASFPSSPGPEPAPTCGANFGVGCSP